MSHRRADWFRPLVVGAGVAGAAAAGLGGVGVVGLGAATGGALAALAALAGGVTVASARPELEVFGPCLRRGTHPGRAALTIDDGPHPASTPTILDTLGRRGLRATFFVLADRVRRHPDLFAAILAAGHEVGLHGLTHDARLTFLPPAAGAENLRQGVRALEDAGAPPIRWFRPPFGVTSPRLHDAVRLAGLEIAWCSVRTGDGVRIAVETLRARCRRVVGTDIVLLHDGTGPTAGLLGEIVDEWDARGIRACSLAQVLEPA